MSKPLALMDVDGVLNLYGIKPSDDQADSGAWPVPKMGFDVHAGVFQFYQIFWHTNLPRIIRRLSHTHDIAWATSWHHDANDFWLEKMGLVRNLPVLDLGERPLDTSDEVSWKASRLAHLLPMDSTGLWFDDEVTGAEHNHGLPLGIIPVRINPKVGLTMTKLRSLGL